MLSLMVQIIKAQSRMYHVFPAYTCHRLHWTDILSKTFTFSDPNSRVQNSFRDLWFPSHKFYNIKQCRLHAQIFPDILYPTRLYTCTISSNDRARHRHDAPILLRDIMASSTSILEYLVNVNSMHGRIKIFNTNVLKYTSSFFLI